MISTSEELEIALDEMSEHDTTVNKLYVVLQNERGNMPNLKTDKILHPGVICDVCENNIRGFRFKCMQCPDYDLCTSCMTMGYHPEHFMVRMTEPVEWSSYHGRRLAHHMRKFMKKASSTSYGDKEKDDETRRCPYKNSGGRRSGCSAGGKVGFDPTFVDHLEDYVKNLCVPLEEPCHEQKRSKEQQREPSTEAATEATEDTQQANSFTQLLKLFEQNVSSISQFLDPLGINIVVTSDNDNSASKPAPNNTPAAESSAPSQPEVSTKLPGEGKKLHDDIFTAKTAAQAAAQVAATTAAAAAATAAAAAAAATAAPEKEHPAATNDISSSSSSSSAASPQATQKVGFREHIVDEPEWTVVGHETPDISRTSSVSSSANGAAPKQQVCPENVRAKLEIIQTCFFLIV